MEWVFRIVWNVFKELSTLKRNSERQTAGDGAGSCLLAVVAHNKKTSKWFLESHALCFLPHALGNFKFLLHSFKCKSSKNEIDRQEVDLKVIKVWFISRNGLEFKCFGNVKNISWNRPDFDLFTKPNLKRYHLNQIKTFFLTDNFKFLL